ncbi:MAG: Hpt domain-containing protein [Lachnospiraceae bacterium]|nr:Hpt domain-containing protein [Lachnospiraceae bacterium]
MVFERLSEHGCDIEGTMKRFMGKRELYCRCLCSFITDETMNEIEDAFGKAHIRQLAEAVHRMKGISGNLGFSVLHTITSDMTTLFRADRHEEAVGKMPELREAYKAIMTILKENEEELGWTR